MADKSGLNHDETFEVLSKNPTFVNVVRKLLEVDPESKVYVEDLLYDTDTTYMRTEVFWCTNKFVTEDEGTRVYNIVKSVDPEYRGSMSNFLDDLYIVEVYEGDPTASDSWLLNIYFDMGERLFKSTEPVEDTTEISDLSLDSAVLRDAVCLLQYKLRSGEVKQVFINIHTVCSNVAPTLFWAVSEALTNPRTVQLRDIGNDTAENDVRIRYVASVPTAAHLVDITESLCNPNIVTI